MKYLEDIKSIITIAATAVAIVVSIWGTKWKQEADRFESNLYKKEVQWKDEKGRLVTEVTELSYTRDELKRISKSDSSKLSYTEKQLYIVTKELQNLNIKPKDVEAYNKAEFEVKNDSLITTIDKDNNGQIKALKPIKTPNLSIEFYVKNDTIKINHSYKASVTTVLNRKEDKLTYKGKKRFFLARLIAPRYEYWSTNIVDDPNAEIVSDVYLNFGRFNK